MRLSSLLVIAPMVAAAPRSPRGGAMIAGTVQLCAATQFENCKNQIIRIKDLDQCSTRRSHHHRGKKEVPPRFFLC